VLTILQFRIPLRDQLSASGDAKLAKRPSLAVLGNSRKLTFPALSLYRTAPAIAARSTVLRLRRLREEAAKENT
jgi:hypothetical protein